jgi:hypothetical protein
MTQIAIENEHSQAVPEYFRSSVARLLADTETWAQRQGLGVSRSQVTLNEEVYGQYEVDKLCLRDASGKKIAEIVPIAASVIGAKGRVDMVGALDHVILVDLDAGGPAITTTVEVNGQKESHTKPLYRGIQDAGWYWIESRKLSLGRKLDEALFLDLLAEVSDYECR